MSHEAYLRSALSKYRYPDQTKQEVLAIFRSFSDLRPLVDNYVFNDGTTKELLCLDGTIPVTYKGKTYNIPIRIYLLDTHPYNPPLIYVRPTPTMQIKQGRHVDMAGRVYLPYLHEWKHPSSDLMGVIQIMAIIFGEEPPVFSKPPNSAATVAQTPYSGGPVSGQQPPYPTTATTSMPVPGYTPSAGQPFTPGNQFARPNYPVYQNQPQPSSFPGYTQPYPATQSYQPQTAVSQPSVGSTALSDEERRLSLLSAVEDKMKRRLREIFAQAEAEMDSLKKTQEDLQKGRQKLDDMLKKLEREQNDVEANIRLLQDKDAEILNAIENMKNKEDLSIDDAVMPTAPLYKQLLNSFAEEQAIDDAIYYLGEALRKGVIDLDVFLKQVRELSRRQFMLRMVVHKCRQKAGLPDITG